MRTLLIVTAFVFVLVSCTTAQRPGTEGFVDRTSLIESNDALRRYGIAVTHLDGVPHAFVTGFGGPNQLLRWENGSVVDVTPEVLRSPDTDSIGAAWCDVDGDGVEELYVLTTDTYGGRKQFPDQLFDRTASGWRDVFAGSEVPNRFAGRSVACTYTPSGYAFFVARYGGPMQLIGYENGSYVDMAPRYGFDRVTGGRSIVNIPTDTGVDIFAGNERGPNYYYEQVKDSYVERAAELGVDDQYENARGVAVYDADTDGDFDMALGNWEGPHRLWIRGNSSFVDVAGQTPNQSFREPSPIRSVVAADFDNDGSQELFMNNIGAPNKYFSGLGVPQSIGDALEAEGLGTGGAFMDLNRDGVLELLLAHGESGAQPLRLYSHESVREGIQVVPQWKDGSPARGARVTFLDAGEVHAVDGGSAYLNQMEPIVHRGGTLPVRVAVLYPDGQRVEKQVSEYRVVIRPE